MSQSGTAPLQDSTAESSTASKRFECTVPNCKKLFRRKEHLTRHLKSHDAQLQYACHICGRRYARSDVLKRHVEFHPQNYKSKRNFVACARCRESKTKCDEENPCSPCRRKGLQCARAKSNEASANADNIIPEASPSLSSSPPSPMHTPEESKLGEYAMRDPEATQRRLSVYYTGIHPIWPILQPSTVTASRSPGLLIAAIMMLASWIEGDLDHLELFPHILDEIMERQLDPNPPVPILQAIALGLLYSTCCLATEDTAFKALKIHNILVAACRSTGILASQRGILCTSSHVYTEQEDQEERYRLAFAVLRLDAYLTALTDCPPLVRCPELTIPLCQTTSWVNVATEEERQKLLEDEPALRKKTVFSFRVHDLFGAPRSNTLASAWTEMDYHFVLCSMQSGAWEASHQALRTVTDDIHSRTHHQDLRTVWREHLNTWTSGLENDCQVSTKVAPYHHIARIILIVSNIRLRTKYFTVSRGDDIAPQTLLLWHITSLKLNAPPDLWDLQGRYYKLRHGRMSPEEKSQHSLRPWQISKIARLALWHSAQIARIASSEFELGAMSSRLRLNPLLIPALLMSAIVVCGYAYYTPGCPLCAGSAPIDLVVVFAASEECERLTRWLDHGEGLPNWGLHVFTGFPVCQCRVFQLSQWFREFLARDEQADAALMMFVDELKAGWW
ncbi:hypothetical protein GGR51DRAFT_568978 [Nemania sp. FL0031]|nr:hypothetical protein GGR51DRAFT_568978 [Nemania sp. FL0031]